MIVFECLKNVGMTKEEVDKRLGRIGTKKHTKITGHRKIIKNKKKKRSLYSSDLTYKQYLNSQHWKEFKKKYWLRNKKLCFCCSETATDIHHHNYKNLFQENDKDVVAVCNECHFQIHNLILNDKQTTIKNGHNVLRGLISLGLTKEEYF